MCRYTLIHLRERKLNSMVEKDGTSLLCFFLFVRNRKQAYKVRGVNVTLPQLSFARKTCLRDENIKNNTIRQNINFESVVFFFFFFFFLLRSSLSYVRLTKLFKTKKIKKIKKRRRRRSPDDPQRYIAAHHFFFFFFFSKFYNSHNKQTFMNCCTT